MEIKTTDIDVPGATKMAIHWAAPADGKRGPGIIVFQEAFGVNSHIRDVVKRFAREGYWAAAPELFHRTAKNFESGYTDWSQVAPHMQAITAAGLEADAKATYDWLTSQPNVIGEKVACIGFCLGGRASFVANSALPLQAAISFYGGGIAPDFLPLAAKQHGPILLCWGGLDKHIPAAKTRAVADALSAAQKSFIHAEFSDGDHGFFCDERATFNAKVAAEAWALSLAFLKSRLA
jgi:carboxymethylenebutenolidase